jgi:hypothetical protein
LTKNIYLKNFFLKWFAKLYNSKLSFFAVPSNCEYIDQPGTYLPFTDTYVPNVEDLEGCRRECTSVIKYNCRSELPPVSGTFRSSVVMYNCRSELPALL